MRLITVFSIAPLLVGGAIAFPLNAERDSLFVARDYNSNTSYVGRSVQLQTRAFTLPDSECSTAHGAHVVHKGITIQSCWALSGHAWKKGVTCYDTRDLLNRVGFGRQFAMQTTVSRCHMKRYINVAKK
ncbi:hypothetical protein AX17_003959, partial [Amanita inopinata Kibby_2008]